MFLKDPKDSSGCRPSRRSHRHPSDRRKDVHRRRRHRRRGLRLRRDRRVTGAVNALDCVDGRGIAGATTTEDPATTTSKQLVGSRGRGGDDDDDVDPRGNDDDNTTISLAMAAAIRVAGDE